jgi:type IV pilus assembly protein PilQ
MSKVYRLNQVAPNSAADYLANLGASVTKTNTIATAVTQGGDQNQPGGAPDLATTQSSSQTTVDAYGAASGPLIGLRATTDTRLGTITLVGDASVIAVAEQYLRQLDLRQRQVALSVKILDVNLGNVSEVDNSFAFRYGNNFIVNDQGRLLRGIILMKRGLLSGIQARAVLLIRRAVQILAVIPVPVGGLLRVLRRQRRRRIAWMIVTP